MKNNTRKSLTKQYNINKTKQSNTITSYFKSTTKENIPKENDNNKTSRQQTHNDNNMTETKKQTSNKCDSKYQNKSTFKANSTILPKQNDKNDTKSTTIFCRYFNSKRENSEYNKSVDIKEQQLQVSQQSILLKTKRASKTEKFPANDGPKSAKISTFYASPNILPSNLPSDLATHTYPTQHNYTEIDVKLGAEKMIKASVELETTVSVAEEEPRVRNIYTK